jgi:hypothetical protein
MNKIAKVVLGAITGAGVGFVGGFAIAFLWAIVEQALTPGDPSAGAVVVMFVFTAPAGAILGTVVGGVLASLRH